MQSRTRRCCSWIEAAVWSLCVVRTSGLREGQAICLPNART
jgi:hypothetical protein